MREATHIKPLALPKRLGGAALAHTVELVFEEGVSGDCECEWHQPLGFEAHPSMQLIARDVITIGSSASLTDCMEAMTVHKIRYLPVFEASTLLGVLSIGEVVRHVIEEQHQLIEQLKSYIHGS